MQNDTRPIELRARVRVNHLVVSPRRSDHERQRNIQQHTSGNESYNNTQMIARKSACAKQCLTELHVSMSARESVNQSHNIYNSQWKLTNTKTIQTRTPLWVVYGCRVTPTKDKKLKPVNHLMASVATGYLLDLDLP